MKLRTKSRKSKLFGFQIRKGLPSGSPFLFVAFMFGSELGVPAIHDQRVAGMVF